MVSPMAYSTPAWSLTFSKVLATSQGHSVSSLSQLQSTLAARRKGDARQLKGNVATKKRSKLDTNDGSPQKGNAAKKKRGKSGAGHKAAGKGTANTDTRDDAGDDNKEERRGKSDAWDEAEYDDEDNVLPVMDAPFEVRQQKRGAWRSLIQLQLLQRIGLSSCRGLFHLNQPTLAKQKPRVLLLHLLKLAGLRVRLTTLCIS